MRAFLDACLRIEAIFCMCYAFNRFECSVVQQWSFVILSVFNNNAVFLQASFSPGVGTPGGPGVSTGVRPLRHLSPTDYMSASSRLPTPSYSSVTAPAVYPPGAVRTHGQPQPAGFPGAVDCHGNPAGNMYPASSCHQQPSPVSAPFNTQQPVPHNYPVSDVIVERWPKNGQFLRVCNCCI